MHILKATFALTPDVCSTISDSGGQIKQLPRKNYAFNIGQGWPLVLPQFELSRIRRWDLRNNRAQKK